MVARGGGAVGINSVGGGMASLSSMGVGVVTSCEGGESPRGILIWRGVGGGGSS